MDIANLIKAYGQVTEFITPSGFKVYIREQNGEDDALLSNVSLAKEAGSVNAFIQDVVVWAENASAKDNRYTEEEVLGLRLRDKYAILMRSRIFSLGPILKFGYKWSPDLPETQYEEDLSVFLVDYSREFPKGEFKAIPPYPTSWEEPYRLLTLTSGKLVRFKYMDGYSEKYLLKLPDFNLNVNSQIIARRLELQIDPNEDKWVEVKNFKMFSSRDMMELRKDIEDNDPSFDGLIDITSPYDGEKQNLSLIGIPSFFFPREI